MVLQIRNDSTRGLCIKTFTSVPIYVWQFYSLKIESFKQNKVWNSNFVKYLYFYKVTIQVKLLTN